jgi:hypothetical protein
MNAQRSHRQKSKSLKRNISHGLSALNEKTLVKILGYSAKSLITSNNEPTKYPTVFDVIVNRHANNFEHKITRQKVTSGRISDNNKINNTSNNKIKSKKSIKPKIRKQKHTSSIKKNLPDDKNDSCIVYDVYDVDSAQKKQKKQKKQNAPTKSRVLSALEGEGKESARRRENKQKKSHNSKLNHIDNNNKDNDDDDNDNDNDNNDDDDNDDNDNDNHNDNDNNDDNDDNDDNDSDYISKQVQKILGDDKFADDKFADENSSLFQVMMAAFVLAIVTIY